MKSLLRRLLVRGTVVGSVAACTSCIVVDPVPPDGGTQCYDDAGNPEQCKMTPTLEQPDGGMAQDRAREGAAQGVDPDGSGT